MKSVVCKFSVTIFNMTMHGSDFLDYSLIKGQCFVYLHPQHGLFVLNLVNGEILKFKLFFSHQLECCTVFVH